MGILDEYSIEQRASQIFDARSKEYFAEVLSCYISGNYRSAVVMLWSVVVCDLLFKLQYLVELYGDDKAKSILEEIEELRRKNERSSEWELKLLDLVAELTQLLNIVERENLRHLQQQRHLAAHPVVIHENSQLHRPNRDITRALIRNALDGLLTKAPILSKQIVGDLVEDLEQVSNILIDDKDLKTYLESKYFSHFNIEVEKTVFKALWKFVFLSTDERCEKNRNINYRALTLLYDRNPSQFQTQIANDKSYFSNIAKEGEPLVRLIYFLARSPQIYGLLEEHAKTPIHHIAEQETSLRYLAWFVSPSLQEHIVKLRTWIDETSFSQIKIEREIWDALRKISDSSELDKAVVELACAYYVKSPSFYAADQSFNEAIQPMLSMFDLNDCVQLIGSIEDNDQTWGRWRAHADHQLLLDRARELGLKFDPKSYPNFSKGLV